ncbi:MAG: UDP-N-acetyl glucosamine 2-epimerase [candidate division WOR-3 bacterium]
MKIISVVGARPQFIKVMPLISAIKKFRIKHVLVHTGQHYDYEMSKVFFDELEIPEPDYNLGVGSGTHGEQTGEMLKRIEQVLIKEKPDWVLVYGDTNSTLAGALAAKKLHIKLAHIEAGLRSYNRLMPEETNRVLTDHCSDILFCPTENAVKNLKKEGFTNILNNGKLISLNESFPRPLGERVGVRGKISTSVFPIVLNVGDIMYDALLMSLPIAEKKSKILEKLKLRPKEYYLATIHRAENTDDPKRLKNIIKALIQISKHKPVIFPIHPRTYKKISELGLLNPKSEIRNPKLIKPVGYLDMLLLEKNALKIITDSGGVQKEAYLLKVPCITLREETEWVETVESGWNVVVTSFKANKIATPHILEKSNQVRHYVFGIGNTSAISVIILLEMNQQIYKK